MQHFERPLELVSMRSAA